MDKVREKISALTEDFDKELYYDREKLINQCSYEEGYVKRNNEIAKAMLKKNMAITDIIEITGLTEEELNSLE